MIIEFPFRKHYSDEKIVKILSEGPIQQEEEALKYLYINCYHSIQKMILSRGGNKSDVPDIFQDSIIVFYENVKSNKFQLKQSIKGYLYIIAQNKWINKQKKRNRIEFLDNFEEVKGLNDSLLSENDFEWNKYTIIDQIMEKLKPDCRLILQLSIYQKLSMNDIAQHMGFKNEQIARNKKSKCLSYLRNILRKFPEYKKALNTIRDKG